MKYYKNEETNLVYGYEESNPIEMEAIQKLIDAGYTDVTDSWPPAPEPIPEPTPPTKNELLAELELLTAKIKALSND